MSLFVFQQNLPYQAVINYLQTLEPASPVSPYNFARQAETTLKVGDIIFVLEPIFSPWGDASTGIGVADGDSFKVVEMAVIYQHEGEGLFAYLINNDIYERHFVVALLAQEGERSRGIGQGFYYLVSRPSPDAVAKAQQALSTLESRYGNSGWRSDDSQMVDLGYAFLGAFGVSVDALPGQNFDFAALGYHLYSDKEPPAGSLIPDLRGRFFPQPGSNGEVVVATESVMTEGSQPVMDMDESTTDLPQYFKQEQSQGTLTPPPVKAPQARRIIPAKSKNSPQAPGGRVPPLPIASPSALQKVQRPENQPAANVPQIPPAQEIPESQLETYPTMPAFKPVQEVAARVEEPVAAVPPPEPAPTVPPPPASTVPPVPQSTNSTSTEAPPSSASGLSAQLFAIASVPAAAQSASSVTPPPPVPAAEPPAQEAEVSTNVDVPVQVEPVEAGTGEAPQAPPRTRRQQEHEARAQELQNRTHQKETVVKSGVAGLASKLEQQASKASTKLEMQVEEVQTQLTNAMHDLVDKVTLAERNSIKSAEGLRTKMAGSLESACRDVAAKVMENAGEGAQKIQEFTDSGSDALKEKHDYLQTSLKEAFDDVKSRTETLARSFEESSSSSTKEVLEALKEKMDEIDAQFTGMRDSYDTGLQKAFDHFKTRVVDSKQSIVSGLEATFKSFDAETSDLKERCRIRLEHIQTKLAEGLTQRTTDVELDVKRKQAVALTEKVIPKLQEHRDTLRAMSVEFQQKLTEVLETQGNSNIAAFEPMLVGKKQQLTDVLAETTKIKESIESKQRAECEQILTQLADFVELSVKSAKDVFKSTEESIAEIDRSVRVLADPSSIESDMSLLDERNAVLGRMDESTEKSTAEVIDALKTKVAALEERGKQLQEDLISGMEEDAYIVRRASEQALNKIRDAIKDTFMAIQSAQDNLME